MPTQSEDVQSIRRLRERLLTDTSVVGPEVRRQLTQRYDEWLRQITPHREGIALVAVGSYGREELAPHSDLDLLLLHRQRSRAVSSIADRIWYPIWDAGVGLDHSVRTVEETVALAADDIKVMLGILDIRYVAGDRELADEAGTAISQAWRTTGARRAIELRTMARERQDQFGSAAYLLEPNLKQSYGGLRDGAILRALARAQLIDIRPNVQQARVLLLDVRSEVHRVAGRAADVLRAQDRGGIAQTLGFEDGDTLLRSVNDAARSIAHASDMAFRRAAADRPKSLTLRARLRMPTQRVTAQRVGLAKDVVSHNGEVVLSRDAHPATDRGLPIRVASAAAQADLVLSQFTLDRLMAEGEHEVGVWTGEMRDDFVALLAASGGLLHVWESLDQQGLIARYLPEWDYVRSRPQYNAVHRFTVDRHLLETVLQVDANKQSVRRPDLLLVAALLHDIGKGQPGDHSEAGTPIATAIATRMGFTPADVGVIGTLVRHHLLLSHTAARRDLNEPLTSKNVADTLGESPDTIDLLQALTRADALATGPGIWTDWKSTLVDELVRQVRAHHAGTPVNAAVLADDVIASVDEAYRADTEAPVVVTIAPTDGVQLRVVVAARSADLSMSAITGVLALEMLAIRRASIARPNGIPIHDFLVEPMFGVMPTELHLTRTMTRVRDGSLDVAERLARKEASYGKGERSVPELLWFDDEATEASVLEVRAVDAYGLLSRITDGLQRAELLVRSAVVETYGPNAVDSFYLTTNDGTTVPARVRAGAEAAIIAAVSG